MVSIFVNDEDLKAILQYVNRVDILVMEDSEKEKELFKDVDLQMNRPTTICKSQKLAVFYLLCLELS